MNGRGETQIEAMLRIQAEHDAAEAADRAAHPADYADADMKALGRVIWTTSRADESTISATGADIVARAILGSDWLAALLDRERREVGERVAQAIEAENQSFGVSDDPYGGEYDRGAHQGLIDAARIARDEAAR